MKAILFLFVLIFFALNTFAQGCSDAGVCSIGNFNAGHTGYTRKPDHKNEISLSYIYGTHGKYERFYQPQLNYRFIKNNKSYLEIRLPFGIAKNKLSRISTSGIGDMTVTYNSKILLTKKQRLDYSTGLRISFSNTDKTDGKNISSYPMTLQNGLGTTDLLLAVNYDIGKYLSAGAGMQLPLLQYNNNKAILYPANGASIYGDGFRRRPDALLKITGHYQFQKLKINGSVLGIFHLGDDYYNTGSGKYFLRGSHGTTLNWSIDIAYSIGKRWTIGFIFAEPFKTRAVIPDGLARSRILNPSVTYKF